MSDSGNAGSWAVDLNQQQVSPFNQILMHQNQMAQQNRLRQDAIDERNQNKADREREREDLDKSNALHQYTSMKLDTPIESINNIQENAIQDALLEASSPEKSKLPVAQYKSWLASKWLPIINGSQNIKNAYLRESQAAKLHVKNDPTLDEDKLMNVAINGIVNDHLIKDDNGKTIYKSIDPKLADKRYVSDAVLNDYNTGNLISQKAKDEWLGDLKDPKNVEPSSYWMDLKNGGYSKFSKKLTPYEVVNTPMDANRYVKEVPKSYIASVPNAIDPETKQPVKALPMDLMTSQLLGTPRNQRIFNQQYYQHVKDIGLPQDKWENPLYKQIFAYDLLSHHLGNGNPIHEVERKEPTINKTNISLGKDVPVIDAYKGMQDLFHNKSATAMPLNEAPAELQSYFVNKADDLNPEAKYNQSNTVLFRNPDNTYSLNKAEPYVGADGFKHVGVGDQIFKIDKTGINVQANKGGGTKVHNKVVAQSASPNPAPSPVGGSVTYKANGKTYHIPSSEVSEFVKAFPNAVKQ